MNLKSLINLIGFKKYLCSNLSAAVICCHIFKSTRVRRKGWCPEIL